MSSGDGASLRERLGELVRKRRTPPGAADATAAAGAVPASAGHGLLDEGLTTDARPVPTTRTRKRRVPITDPSATGVEAFLPGGEWRHERHGSVYVHERLRSQVERVRSTWGRLPEPPPGEVELSSLRHLGLHRCLFLDLETCGLASSPAFLAGTMHWNGEDFVLRQYFARHYGEEAALVAAVSEQAQGFEALVTFNGKSYDAPYLAARALTHGVTLRWPRHHLDLLHHARRRWKMDLPDCRLTTLEWRVCRRRRVGDLPSDEIPGLYHDYVRNGDPWRLVPVFHHNLLDVTTMADVLHALCTPPRRREAE